MEKKCKAIGECSLHKQAHYKWYKWFQNSCEPVEDDVRVGRLITSTTNEKVK